MAGQTETRQGVGRDYILICQWRLWARPGIRSTLSAESFICMNSFHIDISDFSLKLGTVGPHSWGSARMEYQATPLTSVPPACFNHICYCLGPVTISVCELLSKVHLTLVSYGSMGIALYTAEIGTWLPNNIVMARNLWLVKDASLPG